MRRQASALLAALFLALTTIAFGATPASAHTGFESSEPADGSLVSGSVSVITLNFSGEAQPTGAGFEILSDGSLRIPDAAESTDGTTWVLQFSPPLDAGEVGVRWEVKAADAHPIDGTFAFSIAPADPGEAADNAASPAALAGEATSDRGGLESPPNGTVAAEAGADSDPAADSSQESAQATSSSTSSEGILLEDFLTAEAFSPAPAWIATAGRILGIAGAILAIGALIFAGFVLIGNPADVRVVLGSARAGGLLVVLGMIGQLVGNVAREADTWAGLTDPSVVRSVMWSWFGLALALRISGGTLVVVGTKYAVDRVTVNKNSVEQPAGSGAKYAARGGTSVLEAAPPARIGRHDKVRWNARASIPALGGISLLLLAYAFDGHTATEGQHLITGFTSVLHSGAAAVWAGGVAMLAVVLTRRRRRQAPLDAAHLAARFSVVAAASVAVVGAAGLALTVIILETPSQLWATGWGRILLVKTAAVVAAGAIGAYNHKVLIPRLMAANDGLPAPADGDLDSRFQKSVFIESAIFAAVVVLTALLVTAAK